MQTILARVLPLLMFVVFLTVAILGFMLLSTLLIWGAVIGAVIYFVLWLKIKLFPPKNKAETVYYRETRYEEKKGRVIDYDEVEK